MLLDKSAILVVEDEPFIALDLAASVLEAGGAVVGPAASVKEALALLDAHAVDAAILDVNLTDRDIEPVAERLIASGVPLIFHTSIGLPALLGARFPNLIVHLKPLIAEVLVPQLAALILAKPPELLGPTGGTVAAPVT